MDKVTELQTKKWVSDEIGTSYKHWTIGDFININAGTGTGKSTFVIDELYKEARLTSDRILFITNRDKLKAQVANSTEHKTDTITVVNYQQIEASIIKSGSFNFEMFKYVVCDECHYFLTDSEFNYNNHLSMEAICNNMSSITIFMSATGTDFFRLLKNLYGKKHNIVSYKLKKDYSRINKMLFFENDDSLQIFIDKNVDDNHKVLYFCNNVEKIYNLSKQYEDSVFIFSDPLKEDENGNLVKKSSKKNDNSKYGKHLEREEIKEIIETKTLHRKFTFTTTTMDNGVDLYGKDIKWIIIDGIRDFDTIVQCIGRKRFSETDPDDKINVVIKNVGNQALNGMMKTANDTLEAVHEFIKNGVTINTRYSNFDYCVYDLPTEKKHNVDKHINYARLTKTSIDYYTIKDILKDDKKRSRSNKKNGNKAFIRHVLMLLDQRKYKLIDKICKVHSLEEYLESIVGKRLYKQEQTELYTKMNIKHDGKLMKSRNVLNGSMEELELNYFIQDSKRDTNRKLPDGLPNPNLYKSYWTVCKLIK